MQNQNKFVGNSQSFAPPPPPLPLQLNFCHVLYRCCNIHHFEITKLQVMASKLQVTRSKFTSLTVDTNKFQLTNMLFITF